jgi:putative membrane protein
MKEEPLPEKPADHLDTGTKLAYERTFLAHERTQMAWIRTGLALISFGFTIGKFFQYLREKQGEQATLLGARTVGVTMVAIGVTALVLASVQHWRAMKLMRVRCPGLPESLAGVIAVLLALLGLLALSGLLLRD